MNKNEWLKVVGWIGILIMFFASVSTENFIPYISQTAFISLVLLHAYGKVQAKIWILVGSILFFLVRMFGYEASYDLIDMALWGAIIYLVL